jgi:hypothetical protein
MSLLMAFHCKFFHVNVVNNMALRNVISGSRNSTSKLKRYCNEKISTLPQADFLLCLFFLPSGRFLFPFCHIDFGLAEQSIFETSCMHGLRLSFSRANPDFTTFM